MLLRRLAPGGGQRIRCLERGSLALPGQEAPRATAKNADSWATLPEVWRPSAWSGALEAAFKATHVHTHVHTHTHTLEARVQRARVDTIALLKHVVKCWPLEELVYKCDFLQRF